MRAVLALPVVSLVALLSACHQGDSGGGGDDIGEAAPDARGEIDAARFPLATAGTTPDGAFQTSFASARFATGFCPPGWYVNLYTSDALGADPVLVVWLPLPPDATQAPSGMVPAVARLGARYDIMTDEALFDVQHAELGAENETTRFAGRARVNVAPWQFDFAIDTQVLNVNCL